MENPQVKISPSKSGSQIHTLAKKDTPHSCDATTMANKTSTGRGPIISRFRSETALHQLTCCVVIHRALTFNTCLASVHVPSGGFGHQLLGATVPSNVVEHNECFSQDFLHVERRIDTQPCVENPNKSNSKIMQRKRLTKSSSCEASFQKLTYSREFSHSCPSLIIPYEYSDNSSCLDESRTLLRDIEKSADSIVNQNTFTNNSRTRERLSSCYSTDSVDGSTRPVAPVSADNINLPNIPFRLQQNPLSPEPPMFIEPKPSCKLNVWPQIQESTTQKCSPASSLDSITYVFLDSNPGSSRLQPAVFNDTRNWVSQSVRNNLCQPSSLSTLDSLEVDNVECDSRKSPRTLSVDSVLFEECLRSVREEEPVQTQPIIEPAIPCESSGISSKSDSSSISVQSGSSSTTRRQDSFGMQSTYTVPSAQTRLQTDLIQLMTEVVQLLATQQRTKRSCRYHHRRPRFQRTLPVSKECTQTNIKQPETKNTHKTRELIEEEIRVLRLDRVHVQSLLEGNDASHYHKQWYFPEARPEVSLPLSTSSSHDSKDDQDVITLTTKNTTNVSAEEKLSSTDNSWEVVNELVSSEHFARQLHDSGVDCCSDPTSPNQSSGCNIDDLQTDPHAISNHQRLIQVPSSCKTPYQIGHQFRDWSSRSEQDKDYLLTWMERELDLLERTLAPLDYKPLPERFLKPSSFHIPIPKEFR